MRRVAFTLAALAGTVALAADVTVLVTFER